jgi:hypothetical protein
MVWLFAEKQISNFIEFFNSIDPIQTLAPPRSNTQTDEKEC